MSSVLARRTIVKPPAPIRVNDGTSYFQTNFSPRYLIDKNVLKRIAVIEFVEMSTRSQKGSAITCKTPPNVIIKNPTIH